MEDICRLCCSNKFVNNYIFDEENALYLKMSLYLPIKVFKNDRLPQRICDRCSCKVNDFYQFCNETIEVQNRLRAVLISTAVEIEDSVDLTLIKNDDFAPPMSHGVHKIEPNEPSYTLDQPNSSDYTQNTSIDINQTNKDLTTPKQTCDQSTQTGEPSSEIVIDVPIPLYDNVKVKEEPKAQIDPETVKVEDDDADDYWGANIPSDNSDDVSLIQFKKKKTKKVKIANGSVEKKKRKKELKEWELLMQALPEGTAVTVVDPNSSQPDVKVDVKEELEDLGLEGVRPTRGRGRGAGLAGVKLEPEEFHCCVCLVQCYSRSEMLMHYKEHAMSRARTPTPPPPPAPPAHTDPAEPVKCARCQKRVSREEWVSHWRRHWEKDRRPLRCALCEHSFRDHHQILRHGLTHKWGSSSDPPPSLVGGVGAGGTDVPNKRFVCDVCPAGFVYMRHLLAHRARMHPEAAARELTLRCALCDRQFAHLNSLRRHLRAHTGERNFLCNICGKALSSREHLKFHIRIHTGYKPHVCKTCGKGFVKKCNLTLHERVHSGERPHVCPHCGKAFTQRSTLVIHERYHSGARPYVCPLCKRGFVAKGLLSMHLKTTCI